MESPNFDSYKPHRKTGMLRSTADEKILRAELNGDDFYQSDEGFRQNLESEKERLKEILKRHYAVDKNDSGYEEAISSYASTRKFTGLLTPEIIENYINSNPGQTIQALENWISSVQILYSATIQALNKNELKREEVSAAFKNIGLVSLSAISDSLLDKIKSRNPDSTVPGEIVFMGALYGDTSHREDRPHGTN